MPDLAQRLTCNPLLTPVDITPSRSDWTVECVLNPGAFRYQGRTGLLLRIAERPPQEPGWVSTPIFDHESEDGIRILRIRTSDPHYQAGGPCVFHYQGIAYLTTLSHLRLAWSDDGTHFTAAARPTIIGQGPHETFGVEDCRVTRMGEESLLTYSAVSENGVGVGLARTTDWKDFRREGLIMPPDNKDCGLFDRKIGGYYYALHRPSGVGVGGPFMWVSRSPDLLHWGGHRCIARTRADRWDSRRIGSGASPIYTKEGWLELYHAADQQGTYRLGLMLFDLDDPYRLIARSEQPIMEPSADYERKGFVNGVVFTNGHTLDDDGDTLNVYYGAADKVVCGARFSLGELLAGVQSGSTR